VTTQVARVRERVKRSLLATLAFSQGVPMLSHGDELGRTQRGNNNAYCHDSPLTWVHWTLDPAQQALLEFTRTALALRAAWPALRQSAFLPPVAAGGRGVTWLRADGSPMTDDDWRQPSLHVVGMLMDGDRPLLLLLNGGGRSCEVLPPADEGQWTLLLDSAHEGRREVGGGLVLAPHSLVLLARR